MDSAVAAPPETTPGQPDREALLEQTIAELRRENQLLREKLHYALHRQFGRSTEQFDPNQATLFDGLLGGLAQTDGLGETPPPVAKRQPGGRRKPPKHLPRVRIEHDLPEADKQCTCGACLVRIGEEASEQYDVIPPVFRILEQVRFKYTCPVCGQHGVRTAPKTTPDPLPRHQVTPGLLAWLGTGKYADGLPLHRMAGMLDQRFGVPFTSTTLAQWMVKAHETLLTPLLQAMETALQQADYVHADETTVQVLDEPGRYAWQKSYFWVRVAGTGYPGGLCPGPGGIGGRGIAIGPQRLPADRCLFRLPPGHRQTWGNGGGLLGACAAEIRCRAEIGRQAQPTARSPIGAGGINLYPPFVPN
jgi:transposase